MFVGWLIDERILPQEFVLEAETARLSKANGYASKGKETLQELLRTYDIDTQLGAERWDSSLFLKAG